MTLQVIFYPHPKELTKKVLFIKVEIFSKKKRYNLEKKLKLNNKNTDTPVYPGVQGAGAQD